MDSRISAALSCSWLVAVLMTACLKTPTETPFQRPAECRGESTEASDVPNCLLAQGVLSLADRDSSFRSFTRAASLRDSLSADSTVIAFGKAAELTRALARISQFYGRGLLSDSARFNRMRDHVLVTMEYVRGSILSVAGRLYPKVTPYLGWQFYPNTGVYFQPVTTVNPQYLYYLLPRPTVPLDSLIGMTDALYRYGMWRHDGRRRFIVWEYEFPFNSGGVLEDPPWISSLGQGLALMSFLERFRRTGDETWKNRALDVFESYKVMWDRGGILLPDTTHGYWWEEFNPSVRIWNGSAWSVLGVGYLSQLTGDTTAARVFARGIEAIKYYTPEYDTGSWTLYSRTQGYNTIGYHGICIAIMDQLFAQSGDPWFKTVADRWRTYVPPPGVK